MGVVVTARMAAPARAQGRLAATVTSVVEGDTVRAQLAGGPSLEVQLIGIDTPELDECGGVAATDYMKQVALGRNVTLVDDPTQPSVDQSGRSLFYVDRDDSSDLGQEMLRAGWAQIFGVDSNFQRLPAYLAIRQTAERFPQGVFCLCSGRFHEKTGDDLDNGGGRRLRSSGALPANLEQSLWGRVGDALAPCPTRFRPVQKLEGGLPPIVAHDGPVRPSPPVRRTGGGKRAVARPRPRRLQWPSGPATLPRQVDSRFPGRRLGRLKRFA